jgi:bacteriocin biosynthesis cyclodehydratase domain-containing protein
LLPALLPLLDGTRRTEEIHSLLGEAVAPAVEHAIAALDRAGVLTDGPPLRGSGEIQATAAAELLCEASPTGRSPWHLAASLEASSVVVCGSGETGDRLTRLLVASGVGSVERADLGDLREDFPAAELVVAAPAPTELRELERLNVAALERRLSWLQALPFDGHAAYVGPLFLPGRTCCHRCFQLRRASTSGYRDELLALERVSAAYGVTPPVSAAIAGLGATIALRWLADRDGRLPGRLWVLELWPATSLSEESVYRVPRCPACSPADRTAPPCPWYEAAETAS